LLVLLLWFCSIVWSWIIVIPPPLLCTTKEMVSNLKRPSTEWEKIFASYTSDKGLITRIHREFKN
jgi:hypothetical protein